MSEVVRSWTVGRDRTCDVRVHGDPHVSPLQCRVDLLEDGTYVITDLGSTNGTRIRRGQGVTAYSVRVARNTPIMPGDTLIVGRSEIPRGKAAEPDVTRR